MTLKKQLFSWRITLPQWQEQRDEHIKQIREIKLADFVFLDETPTVEGGSVCKRGPPAAKRPNATTTQPVLSAMPALLLLDRIRFSSL